MMKMDICRPKIDSKTNMSSHIKREDSRTMDDSLTDFSVGDSSSLNASSVDDAAKQWKTKYEDRDKQCKCLKKENEMINIELAHERYKSNKIQKKLQFIRDNQEIFARLKDAYMSMKYNEATGRKIVSIHEQGVQTYEGILCPSCVETEKLREELSIMKTKYLTSVLMSKEDYNRMQATMAVLKTTVEKREKQWSFNMEREHQYKTHIYNIENENEFLRSLLKKREETRPVKKTASEESRKDNKDLGALKKIIVKYERKFREKCNTDLKLPVFNDKEKHAIDQLMTKYYTKLRGRIESRSVSCERENPSRQKLTSNKYKKLDGKSPAEMFADNPLAMIDMLLERKCVC